MTNVELRFQSGRYHATPWGRHVNEAAIEWPPSPYRLLRALYDVWKRKYPELPADTVEQVFRKLAAERPSFYLPKAVSAHTRSYLNSNTKQASDKSLIFDGFLSLNPSIPCRIEWNADLTDAERGALESLLRGLNYLGRSESWVEAQIASSTGYKVNCWPINGDSATAATDGDTVDVASPIPPSEYSGKQNWFDALTYSTGEMLKEKRSGPPAMEMVPYRRQKDSVTSWLSPRSPEGKKVISLIELSLHSKVLPLATDAVRIAELVRAALMQKAEEKSPLFAGKNADGTPLRGEHAHAFYLPQFDGLSRINKVMVILNKGTFGARELNAARALRRLWQFGEESMRVVVTRAESVEVLPRQRVLTSLTPFVPSLHWRPGRGKWDSFIEEQIRSECVNHGLPEPLRVSPATNDRRFEAVHFRRSRKGEAPRKGVFVRLEFEAPVRVPFSLGYCCHFGLGQFGEIAAGRR